MVGILINVSYKGGDVTNSAVKTNKNLIYPIVNMDQLGKQTFELKFPDYSVKKSLLFTFP